MTSPSTGVELRYEVLLQGDVGADPDVRTVTQQTGLHSKVWDSSRVQSKLTEEILGDSILIVTGNHCLNPVGYQGGHGVANCWWVRMM